MSYDQTTADCLAEVRRLTDDYAAATHLLADRDAQIERLTAERDALVEERDDANAAKEGYFAERNRARDAWRRRIKKCDALQAKLDAAVLAEREKSEAMRAALAIDDVMLTVDDFRFGAASADDVYSAIQQYATDDAAAAVLAEQEKAEAMRAAILAASAAMHGNGVDDQGEAWDRALRILDAACAAIRAEPKKEQQP